jgi:4-amino-4-deoxy-L-arabinose transferase-like glycosyltransferase
MREAAGRLAGGWPLLLLTAAFLFRGVFFALALPAGDPLDETYHFAYASFMAQTGRVPRAGENSIPIEFGRATATLPATGPSGAISWGDYSRLPEERRRELRAMAYEYRPAERETFFAPNYETQQPPLFYGLAASFLKAFPRAPFSTRLAAVRLLSVLLAALAIPLAYRFLRRLFPRRTALAATAALTAFPGIGIFAGRFTNDTLALPIAAALLGLFVDAARDRLSQGKSVAMAALFAAALWTKLYFLLLLPAVLALSLLARTRRSLGRALLATAASVVVFLPWALHQRAQTGDWLGLYASKQATALAIGLPARLAAFPDLLRARFAIVFGRTFLWPGTRSASGAPAVVSVVLAATLLLLVTGAAVSRAERSRFRARAWWAGGFAALAFLVGQFAYASTYAAVGRARGLPPSAGPDGWYLLLLFPVILTAGCLFGRSIPSRWFLLSAAVFLVAEALMTFGVLPGVYTGRTAFNGANVPISVYGGQLLRPAESILAFERVGLAGLSSVSLGLVVAIWLFLQGAGIALAVRTSPSGGARRRL